MNLSEIVKYRLINQQIAQTHISTAAEMVTWFGAVQAQEYAQAKWGLGLRLPHLKNADIEKDLTEGKILRTHLLRPTWHFVSAKDIRWLLMLTAPRVQACSSYMHSKLGLNAGIFNRCNRILFQLLKGGKQLTRNAINQEFKRNKIKAAGHLLSYIMMQAELEGIICSGAKQGNQFTYALLEERVAPARSKNRDEALAELTTRYFTSRGPATLKDYSTWSGLTLGDCKKGIEMVNSLFHKEIIKNEAYFLPFHTSAGRKQLQKIHLLPIYDEFIMGYKDRRAMMLATNTPGFRHDNVILCNGQIIGTWKRSLKAKNIELEYVFFEELHKTLFRAFSKTLRRFEEFNNLPVNYTDANRF